MKCSLRQLTCVVSLLLLFLSTGLAEVLDEEGIRKLAVQELRKTFGDRVKLKEIHIFLSRPIHYQRIERRSLNLTKGSPRGSFHIYLRTKKGLRRVSASLDVLWRCEVLVATEEIPKGERLYPWQTALELRYMSRCPKSSISQEELLNYVALRHIQKGEPIRKSYLKKEPLVRRGDEVDVIFRSGNLEIGFRGEALDTGFYGDTVRVRSLNTGKILRGRVVSEGSVLVR